MRAVALSINQSVEADSTLEVNMYSMPITIYARVDVADAENKEQAEKYANEVFMEWWEAMKERDIQEIVFVDYEREEIS